MKATHKGANKNGDALQQTISTTLLEDNALENEYMKFMMKYYSEVPTRLSFVDLFPYPKVSYHIQSSVQNVGEVSKTKKHVGEFNKW